MSWLNSPPPPPPSPPPEAYPQEQNIPVSIIKCLSEDRGFQKLMSKSAMTAGIYSLREPTLVWDKTRGREPEKT